MSEQSDHATRRGLIAAALTATAATALASAARAQQAADGPVSPAAEALIAASGVTGDVHDWDYLMGDWTSAQRRMKKRWTASPEWDEFPGTTRYIPFMGGLVNMDETDFPTRGFAGVTVRTFSTDRKLWSIYWINSKAGILTSPMVGGYKDDVGYFYGDDVDDGVPIVARYIRTKRRPDGERWEQAFSKDAGKTWETNWSAEFTRVKGKA